MTKRALKARWPIPDVARGRLVKECRGILDSKESSARDKLGAAKVLLLADRLNMEQEKLNEDAPSPPPAPQVTVNVAIDLSPYADAFRTFAASLIALDGSSGAIPPDGAGEPLGPP